MEYVFDGAQIEAAGTNILSRKIVASAAVDIPNVGKCMKYNCSRNSSACITKELEPKQPRFRTTSILNNQDSIKAKNMVVHILSKRPLKISKVPLTSRHNSQATNTRCYTHAQISMPFHNLGELYDEKQIAPKETPLLEFKDSKE